MIRVNTAMACIVRNGTFGHFAVSTVLDQPALDAVLTLSSIYTHFNTSKKIVLGNHRGKR